MINRESAHGLKVTRLTDKSFRRTLEMQLATGSPLLIEDVPEEIDSILNPIIEKRFIKKPSGWMLMLADKDVDFNPNFQVLIEE